MKLYIASDHGGYDAKVKLINYLKDYDVEDLGCNSTDIVRYPYYAARVAHKVLDNPGSRGILICSTGIGMSIIANKFKGIRAALCTDGYMAKMTRLHNDSNILCLGGRITGEYVIQDIADAWLSNSFEGGRHSISLGLIEAAESDLFGGKLCGLVTVRRENEL